MWWAGPLGLAVLSAVVFVSVVLPALTRGPEVPAQLVVNPGASVAATSRPSTPATGPASATPHPTATKSVARPVPLATVVSPVHPVIRQSDDQHEDRRSPGTGESNDR